MKSHFFQRSLFRFLAILWLAFSTGFAEEKSTAEKSPEPFPGFQKSAAFNEQTLTFTNENGIRIHINAPSPETFSRQKNVKLVLYALPNGNSIEHTIGKKTKAGDDWHFNIQHIGAQTRWLREMVKEETIVVAYLEATTAVGKSWPAWRKKNGDKGIPAIIESVKAPFKKYKVVLVLAGHSGGGSFTFGYLNTVEKIPTEIERIAFLDSNYGYETALHKMKLVNWLKASEKDHLMVLAYHDNIALLQGKTFVSAAGGTWGKSHLMKTDFESEMKMDDHVSPEWENYSALDGRLKFFLRENPEKKILHTVQVERNGFIHVMVAGTPKENRGYEYFGDKVYSKYISAE